MDKHKSLDEYMASPSGQLVDVMGNKLTVLNSIHELHRDRNVLKGESLVAIAECAMDILNAIGDYKDATI